MIDAVIVASDDKFRIVRQEEGDKVTYVVEVPDGNDALGVERWREFRTDNALVRALRDYVIRASVARETANENQ